MGLTQGKRVEIKASERREKSGLVILMFDSLVLVAFALSPAGWDARSLYLCFDVEMEISPLWEIPAKKSSEKFV